VLNESEDAWKLGDYSDRWINVFLSHSPLPAEVERAMLDDLAAVLLEHCLARAPGRSWGWKEPRSIYLLPFFHRHLPALRFLHVVRDGRDLALSSNQNQLRKHGDAAPIPPDLPEAERSIALWSWVNLGAARYGEEHLGDHYLRVRFEDLCARPVEVAGDIFGFFDLEGDPAVALDAIATPSSLGRWRAEQPATIAAFEEQGAAALVELGYEHGPS
jgi:Sulfotransferase family